MNWGRATGEEVRVTSVAAMAGHVLGTVASVCVGILAACACRHARE
jgi:hypothetical protein